MCGDRAAGGGGTSVPHEHGDEDADHADDGRGDEGVLVGGVRVGDVAGARLVRPEATALVSYETVVARTLRGAADRLFEGVENV